MCGIAGAIGREKEDALRTQVTSMLERLVHRGPDSDGIVSNGTDQGSVCIGTRRLAIQDLSASGSQPMVDSQTGNALVFNGEIYNAPTLRHELETKGHSFRGTGDTEVVLHGYLEWGSEICKRLRGMYAFAIWDRKVNRLLLARDPLGIKPLYLMSNGDGLLFASEIRAIQAASPHSLTVSEDAIRDHLAYGSVTEPRTIYEEVQMAEPGAITTVDASGRIEKTERFWQMPEPNDESRSDLVQEVGDLFAMAVKRHLLSDVPVGIFLSAGLDSSAILGAAAEAGSSKIVSFTVTFPDRPDMDEGMHAAQASQRAEVPHIAHPISGTESLQWALQGLQAMDQPAADGLNTYIVARAAHEHGLKVALSGQGGDEVFGGYRTFRGVPKAYRLLRPFTWVPPGLRGRSAGLLGSMRGPVAAEKARDMARTGADIAGLYLHSRRVFSDREMRKLGSAPPAPYPSLQELEQPEDQVSSIARFEMAHYLRNTLLRDGDVFGMASSIEIRVPMLDQDLVDRALSLRGSELLPEGAPPKHLLRSIAKRHLSDEQLTRSKTGFTLPIDQWLQGPLRPLAEGALDNTTGILDRNRVQEIRSSLAKPMSMATAFRIWTLVVLGSWLDLSKASRAGNR